MFIEHFVRKERLIRYVGMTDERGRGPGREIQLGRNSPAGTAANVIVIKKVLLGDVITTLHVVTPIRICFDRVAGDEQKTSNKTNGQQGAVGRRAHHLQTPLIVRGDFRVETKRTHWNLLFGVPREPPKQDSVRNARTGESLCVGSAKLTG